MSAGRPSWARLFGIACSLIRQVNSKQIFIDTWSFGGGTALMLRIDHRESCDVDFFLTDPQLLSFLDPTRRDFEFDISPSDCHGDGARFIKLAFDRVGEIDFIAALPITDTPTTRTTIEGEDVDLETIAEVIAKKVCYRGAWIRARDIFDIAAAATQDRPSIIKALRPLKDDVARTLVAIERMNPDFVAAAIGDLAVKDKYRPLVETALDEATALLRSV